MKNNFMRVFWLVLFTALVFGVSNVPAADFAANPATLGAIPDYPAGQACFNQALYINKDVTFTVSGMPSVRAADDIQIKNLTFSPAHTFAGDIIATLIAPDGTTKGVIFGRTGSTTATGSGDDSDLAGPYLFDNSYSNNFWSASFSVGNSEQIPAGAYYASVLGGVGVFSPAKPSLIHREFENVTNTNGTWRLRFNDSCNQDTGSVSAVTLSIIHRPTTIPTSRVGDRDGDGETDFTIVRADGASSLTESMGVTDETGKDKTGKTESQNNVSPSAIQVSWWTNYSSGISYSKTFWGLDTDSFLSEDFDGDGKTDPAVQRGIGGVQAAQYLLKSSNGTAYGFVWGFLNDFIAPGDYDGDGRTDIVASRNANLNGQGTYKWWFVYHSNGDIGYRPWGTIGDSITQGDYNGDGRTDLAVWRASNGTFYVMDYYNNFNSSTRWGTQGDYPVNNWNVH